MNWFTYLYLLFHIKILFPSNRFLGHQTIFIEWILTFDLNYSEPFCIFCHILWSRNNGHDPFDSSKNDKSIDMKVGYCQGRGNEFSFIIGGAKSFLWRNALKRGRFRSSILRLERSILYLWIEFSSTNYLKNQSFHFDHAHRKTKPALIQAIFKNFQNKC